jgi:hypothetical protein
MPRNTHFMDSAKEALRILDSLGVPDETKVEFRGVSPIPGIRTLADLRKNAMWLADRRLTVDSDPDPQLCLIAVEP